MLVNNKEYPMWGRFVETQEQFIGGLLEDVSAHMETAITGIELRPNGVDSAYFAVTGEDFDCGFDVHYGGLCGGEQGYVTFSGYGGHTWRIAEKRGK